MSTTPMAIFQERLGWGFVVLGLVNLPSYLVLGWLFFGTWSNFVDTIKVSFWSDEYPDEDAFDAMRASCKLLFFLVSAVALLFAEYQLGCWIFSS
jgi:hypothetical protein